MRASSYAKMRQQAGNAADRTSRPQRRQHRYGHDRIHPLAKLTFAEASYIKCAPVPVKRLAREHGVCPKTVRQIRKGETWAWL